MSAGVVGSGASCEIAGERVELLAQAGLWWARERTLFVADVHLGKSAAFRSSGLAVPDACARDLGRLGELIDALGARRLIVLGDLLHARAGRTGHVLRSVDAWCDSYRGVEVVLVRGNHDRSSGDPPASWGLRVVDPGERVGPFALHHEPVGINGAEGYALAGHIHPAVRVGGRGRGRGSAGRGGPKFPAFCIGAREAVLPAFGSFTGTAVVDRNAYEAVYVIADDAVIRVPRERCG